jgi:hypothetical protein
MELYFSLHKSSITTLTLDRRYNDFYKSTHPFFPFVQKNKLHAWNQLIFLRNTKHLLYPFIQNIPQFRDHLGGRYLPKGASLHGAIISYRINVSQDMSCLPIGVSQSVYAGAGLAVGGVESRETTDESRPEYIFCSALLKPECEASRALAMLTVPL